jgi:hypothetical protein
MPGLVPGAGNARTIGLAHGVAGCEGGGARVVVAPNVTFGGETAAMFSAASPSGCIDSRAIATIASCALNPATANKCLKSPDVDRCRDIIFTSRSSVIPL